MSVIEPKQFLCHLLEYLQFVLVDIGALVLAEAVQEELSTCHFRCDNGSDSAALTLSGQRNPLFHDMGSQVCIDQPLAHLFDGGP